MITRRSLGLALAAAPLAACAGGTSLQTVASDVNIIAGAMKGVLVQLGALSIPGLTPQLMAQIGGYVADLQSVAAAISGTSSVDAAKPLVAQVETLVNAIVGALAVLPLPPPISTALQAAAILLPVDRDGAGHGDGPAEGQGGGDERRSGPDGPAGRAALGPLARERSAPIQRPNAVASPKGFLFALVQLVMVHRA
jgi:hypothetical protein